MMRTLIVVLLAALTALSFGQIVVKPVGSRGTALVMRSLKMHTVVEGQIASTEMEAVFNNPVDERVEAEFIYTLQKDMICTFFAYFYGEEQVVARIVEKERAKQIYQHITSRMRDPALIELIGKRTFRAKIFPIMPEQDLKVQMHFVQVLPSNKDGYALELPIKMGMGQTLESIDVYVEVKPGTDSVRISNNYGLTGSDPMKVELKGKSTRPLKNLRVQVSRDPKPLQVGSYAAPSGGRDGFFALTLTPNRTMNSPKLAISGVKVYAISPLPKIFRPNQAVLVTGRYQGTGDAAIKLSDAAGALSASVTFSQEGVPNNPAAMLWGARQIEVTKDPRQGMALSHRFNMPGPFTSWLAIPKEERARYKQEIARAELEAKAQALQRMGLRYGFKSNRYTAAREKLEKQAKANDTNLDYLLQEVTYDLAGEYAQVLAREIARGRADSAGARKAQAAIQALTSKTDLTWFLNNAFGEMLEKLAADVVSARVDGLGSQEVRRREAAYRRIAKKVGLDREDYLLSAYQQENWELSNLAANLEIERKTGTARYRNTLAQMHRIERYTGESPRSVIRRRKLQIASDKMYDQWQVIADEVAHERYSSEKMASAKAKLSELETRFDVKDTVGDNDPVSWALRQQAGVYVNLIGSGASQSSINEALAKLNRMAAAVGAKPQRPIESEFDQHESSAAWYIQELRYSTIRDDAQISAEETKLKRLTAVSKHDADAILNKAKYTGYYREPELRAKAIDEFRKPNNDPAKVNKRFDELEKADTKGLGAKYAKLRRERLLTELEIDKLQHMQVTPEIQKQIDELKVKQEGLRARMGDPLITYDGPDDCRQVVALMPDGKVLPLAYNPATARWEARFDIPPGTAVGDYKVQVIAVSANGKRTIKDFVYTVDYTAPKATAKIERVDGRLRLRVTGDADIWRVEAIFTDGSRSSLSRDGASFVSWTQATLSRGDEVRFVIYDKAHNRSELTAIVP